MFNKMDEDSKHTLIVKGLVVAKQQKFRKTNLKAMKVALEKTLKEALEVDVHAINKPNKRDSPSPFLLKALVWIALAWQEKLRRSMLGRKRRRKPENNPKGMKKKM